MAILPGPFTCSTRTVSEGTPIAKHARAIRNSASDAGTYFHLFEQGTAVASSKMRLRVGLRLILQC